mmetsp:Transcript_8926/g.18508  ORF Transcript_8926/g.18508 Transcript_8926/m.18508 type:complete len:218 (+) Transcript_8926:723-1376(+)
MDSSHFTSASNTCASHRPSSTPGSSPGEASGLRWGLPQMPMSRLPGRSATPASSPGHTCGPPLRRLWTRGVWRALRRWGGDSSVGEAGTEETPSDAPTVSDAEAEGTCRSVICSGRSGSTRLSGNPSAADSLDLAPAAVPELAPSLASCSSGSVSSGSVGLLDLAVAVALGCVDSGLMPRGSQGSQGRMPLPLPSPPLPSTISLSPVFLQSRLPAQR